MPRGLTERFMNDLLDGILSPVLQEVKDDGMTLDFQIRNNEVHIYYRGGKIIGIKPRTRVNGYHLKFEKNYFHDGADNTSLPTIITTRADTTEWIEAFPILKQAIDRYSSRQAERAEREFQQIVSRENTYSKSAGMSDYFIVDIEYQTSVGQKSHTRFDLLGILWPAQYCRRGDWGSFNPTLAVFEMKYGEKAFSNKSGLLDHLEKTLLFAKHSDSFSNLKAEVVGIFKQKHRLGLISCPSNNIQSDTFNISNKKPQYIFLIANHNTFKNELFSIITSEPFQKSHKALSEYMDIRFAVASFLGYGLYESCMLPTNDFIDVIRSSIK